MPAWGRKGGPLTDGVARDLKAAGLSDMKCVPSVAHIRWLDSCDMFHELMCRLQQLTVVLSFRYCTERIIICYNDVNQCSFLHYIIAVCKKTRQAMYV